MLENAVWQPIMLALFMIIFALLEWWRDFMQLKPSPVIYTIAAVLAAGYAMLRIYRSRGRLQNLRQALDGERAVGQ